MELYGQGSMMMKMKVSYEGCLDGCLIAVVLRLGYLLILSLMLLYIVGFYDGLLDLKGGHGIRLLNRRN